MRHGRTAPPPAMLGADGEQRAESSVTDAEEKPPPRSACRTLPSARRTDPSAGTGSNRSSVISALTDHSPCGRRSRST